VDGELNNAKASIDGIRANLALIQRDDGALANGAVTFDTLSASLQTAGLAPALPWVTATVYSASVSVTQGSAFYRSLVAHVRRLCDRSGRRQMGVDCRFRDNRAGRRQSDRRHALRFTDDQRSNVAAGARQRQGADVSHAPLDRDLR
jgi:hypothetical protein